jgi:small conductance mechanosensitive channel
VVNGILFKPFRVGDLIEAQGVIATANEIQIFVINTTANNQTVFVPNGVLSNGTIKLYMEEVPQNRFSILHLLDILLKAKDIITSILENNPKLLKETSKPEVFVNPNG